MKSQIPKLKVQLRLGVCLSFGLWCLMLAPQALAYVASSASYKLDRDSLNFGGKLGTSTNYQDEDTLGEVGTGLLTSTNYILKAGYQQQNSFISITSPADVDLTPSIDGAVGGTASGSATWKVTTDNPTGYTLSARASTNPAMQSGVNNFGDYTPAGADPDFSWSVGAASSKFGYTPEGTELVTRYKDDGASCNTGVGDTASACWDGFSTSDRTIASRATANNGVGGSNTSIRFQATAGASANQPAGTYVAVITVTATTL